MKQSSAERLEKKREYQRAYYKEHKVAVQEYQRKYHLEHRSELADIREANRAKVNASSLASYYKRRDEELLRMRRYYREHKVEHAAYQRRYEQEHKVERAASQRRYRQAHKVERAAYKRRYRQEHKVGRVGEAEGEAASPSCFGVHSTKVL